MIDFFQIHTLAFAVFAGVFGLLVGSFLNVVIARLPRMLEQEWRAQAADGEHSTAPAIAPFNLLTPRSHCPHCGHGITALENIPLVSYLTLGGKCSFCRKSISMRYPLVEALSGGSAFMLAWYYGFSWQAAAALVFVFALIALSFIDFDHQILPDRITVPMIWLGLGLSVFEVFVDSHASIIGAMAGYLSLWMVYQLFKKLTGKEGMGYGDFKLLALLGAWLGWQMLPLVLLLSSLLGAIIGIALIVIRGRDRHAPIPFGPYLALAGVVALLWGNEITETYLHWV